MVKTNKNIQMSHDIVKAMVFKIIKDVYSTPLYPSSVEINEKTRLDEELDFDSLDKVDLVIKLEKAFNINITEEDSEHLVINSNVGRIIDYIDKRLNVQQTQTLNKSLRSIKKITEKQR